MRRRSVLAWLSALAIVAAPASAQVGGNIGGVVKDTGGGVIPGATVTITNTSTNAVQVLQTGAEGNYRAVNLQPAPYEISVEVSGFGTVKKSVIVPVGSDVTVDFALRVGDVSETLTVTAEASPLLIEVSKSQPTRRAFSMPSPSTTSSAAPTVRPTTAATTRPTRRTTSAWPSRPRRYRASSC